MSHKKIKLMRVEHQYKFSSMQEAEREANTIRNFIDRNIRAKDRYCKALIALSEHCIRDSTPEYIKTGKPGRPVKQFVPKVNKENYKKKRPHLHIVIYGCPAETISAMIVKNINRRHRKKHSNLSKQVVSRKYPADEKYISYVIHQATCIRTVSYDPLGILDDLDFMDEYEKRKTQMF